jgi:hypothetical protein
MIRRPTALPFGFERFDKLADFVLLVIGQVLSLALSIVLNLPYIHTAKPCRSRRNICSPERSSSGAIECGKGPFHRHFFRLSLRLVLLAFWGLVGTHAFLYANSQQCWFSLSPKLQEWAQDIYGDRLPRSKECPGDPLASHR